MKFLFFALALFPLNKLLSAKYYVSQSTGNDSYTAAQAQHPATAWKSLNKVNSFFTSLLPGDSVLFKRNDTFPGSLTVTKSGIKDKPIVMAAYGSGIDPVISGLKKLTGFTTAGNKVWQTKLDITGRLNALVLNGRMVAAGRYPNADAANKGYLSYQTFSGNKSITDNDLTTTADWAGAEIVIRKNHWILDRNIITSRSGNKINYTSETNAGGTAGYGYFIQNHPSTLDSQGEWYYNQKDKVFGIYLAGSPNNSFIVEAAMEDTLVYINRQGYISFNHIIFSGANEAAFELKNCQSIALTNCIIRLSGVNAINASGVINLVIDGSIISYTNNIAFNGNNCSKTILSNNRIVSTGMQDGMGVGGSGSYEALMITGDSNLIQSNKIINTGYIPITFRGNNYLIKNNFIDSFGTVKDDGAGIYTWNNISGAADNSGRVVAGNIILNGLGAGAGTDNPENLFSHGIYLDDNSANVLVLSNTIANCSRYGIFIHNAHNITLKKNTVYNNKEQLAMVHDNIAPTHPVYGNVISSNIFFSKDKTQPVAEFKSINNDLGNFGTMDSNYYCRPIDDSYTILTSFKKDATTLSQTLDLEGWKKMSQQDKASAKTAAAIKPYHINESEGVNQISNGDFKSGTAGASMYATQGNASLSWNKDRLDDGTLQLTFTKIAATGNKASIIIAAGEVKATKSYILRFKMAGADNSKPMEVYLRKSLAGYNDISERQLCKIAATAGNYEFLLKPEATESQASIVFTVEEQSAPLYFDNIELREASVTVNQPADWIKMYYNAADAAKKISLSQSFIDVTGKVYEDTAVIESWLSKILIRTQKSQSLTVMQQ